MKKPIIKLVPQSDGNGFQVPVTDELLGALERGGYLPPNRRRDYIAVHRAWRKFLDYVLKKAELVKREREGKKK